MLMLPFSTILVIKDLIVSFRKAECSTIHTITRFSLAPEEVLTPMNPMIYRNDLLRAI
jgi:hypothetical protein